MHAKKILPPNPPGLSFPPHEFMPLDEYMARCNEHYYSTQNAIGSAGDFITAPEISQMFGELIGAWVITRWEHMGRPALFQLIELGPGKGTLMADMLRVLRNHADVYGAVQIHLVETSPRLRAMQMEKLSGFQPAKTWHDDLSTLTPAPFILIANEFLDALPIKQIICTAMGWLERGVMFDGEKHQWATRELPHGWQPEIPPHLREPVPGNILESSPAAVAVMDNITARLNRHPGSALFIDYGYALPDYGDSFQAISQHQYADPLQNPGENDLTAHVNFNALENLGRLAALRVDGPIGQGEFLINLGLQIRADKLLQTTTDTMEKMEVIDGAYRLTAPDEMGSLFKVICLSSPHLQAADGFGGN